LFCHLKRSAKDILKPYLDCQAKNAIPRMQKVKITTFQHPMLSLSRWQQDTENNYAPLSTTKSDDRMRAHTSENREHCSKNDQYQGLALNFPCPQSCRMSMMMNNGHALESIKIE
jgi:hypothetical protein